MKLNLSTMFTRVSCPLSGGGNAGWNLEVGQSENSNYVYTLKGVSEIFNGMLYNKVKDPKLFYYGSDNGEKEFKLISIFPKVKINVFDVITNEFELLDLQNQFIFLLMEDDSEVHTNGTFRRNILKFKKAFKYDSISNDKFYNEIDGLIGIDTPWFGIEMNYYPIFKEENNILIFDIIKCKKDEREKYLNSRTRKLIWNNYIDNYNKVKNIEILEEERASKSNSNPNFINSNTIYYGAPGTGKSYKVDQIIKGLDKKFYERVTFHPEYDNTSFIGGYKPISEKDEEGKNVIKYEFVPQAFANIYKRAWQDLENQYYLVIEEINRGNCAEIFGELFQLLDRNSGYTVAPSNELYKHLVEEFGEENHEGIAKGLQLPPNLAILATMNTSDQSLFPMDSAFKRRWEWEYVPICYDEENEEGGENKSYNFVIDLGNESQYSWIKFIEYINLNHIKENPNLGMDKCIGNYFVKPEEDNCISLKQFINKVVFYLWNDVFKDEDNAVFEGNSSYEDFFPITTNGLKKVTELFERIGLEKLPSKYDQEEDMNIAAENSQTI